MDYIRINSREQLSELVANELKCMGVKCRKEKKSKVLQEKKCNKNIFRMPLSTLKLTDVILTSGIVVQIPIFVADACNRILEQVETEGIFRKAGSSIRQKEIRVKLESGMPLGKSHHVIDVANVIKYFFRELPEPLIPNSLQETLLRSLLIGENQVKAILLACLLLPPLTFNTLRFFMQFLYTVSLSESANKMSSENLAIIFTPGLMPFANINSHRFANHLRVVQMLIENANFIGIVPSTIANMLSESSDLIFSEDNTQITSSTPTLNCPDAATKKKKKRRSGSLTHMFNGFKKMVGSAIGSSEDLDGITRENKVTISKGLSCNTLHSKNIEDNLEKTNIFATPCHKANKKRKFAEPVRAFSSKKKKDLLALLPSNSGGLLPNTPITKHSKKHRLSINGSRHVANMNLNPIVISMERRWSIVGSGWSTNKNKHATEKKQTHFRSDECIFNTQGVDKQLKDDNNDNGREINASVDKPILHSTTFNSNEPYMNELSKSEGRTDNINLPNSKQEIDNDADKRSLIMQDLETLNRELVTSFDSGGVLKEVQAQYERILEETASLSLVAKVELPRRISRDLKIRRSDQQDIRSPSARKIGSLRRRSQDKYSLKHLNSNATSGSKVVREILQYDGEERKHLINTFYTKGQIKLNRHSLDAASTIDKTNQQDSKLNVENRSKSIASAEKWLSAEEFFKTLASSPMRMSITKHVDHAKTPVSRKRLCDIKKTTMSAQETPHKTASNRTPSNSTINSAATSRVPFVNLIALSTPIEDDACGRASISRLRTQNAGMVMAKAKLFDGMGNCASHHCTDKIQRIDPNKHHDQQTVVTNTKNAQRKSTIKGTPGTKQIQGRSSSQRRHLSNVRNANKTVVQTVYNKERTCKQRHIKERTPMGITDGKTNTIFFRHNDFNSPRLVKRRQQRENSCNK